MPFIPSRPLVPSDGTRIYAGSSATGRGWVWDLEYDGQIAFAGTHLYVPENHYAGGIALDPIDPNTVYISADVDPATGQPHPSGRYQIFRGRRAGTLQQWQWTQLTFDSEADNFRPIVPRNHGLSLCVIWLRGRYRTYTDYDTQIAGIVEP